MPITTFEQLKKAQNKKQILMMGKNSISNTTAGFFFSSWRMGAGQLAQGAIPTTGTLIGEPLLGCPDIRDALSGQSTYITKAEFYSASTGNDIQIHDRLGHCGGLSGIVTTAQTVGIDLSLTTFDMANRRGASDYSDVQWWVEIYTDIGGTATTFNISYTDSVGTSGKTITATAIGSTTNSQNRSGRLIPILPNDNLGIRSIQNLTLTATTGTAGNFGVCATRAVAGIPSVLGYNRVSMDFIDLGMPKISQESALMFIVIPSGSSTGTISGYLELVQG